MRKFILIAAMVMVSAAAQAGETRNLRTQASNDEPAAAVPAPSQVTESPKYVERPPAVETRTEQPKADPAKIDQDKPVAEKTAATPKAEGPRRKRQSTEARVIYELHRHGIYW